jgi:sugar porter (SP) family MFS transporter
MASLGTSQSARDRGGTTYVYLLASVAALGGLLFGYDTAVISGAIGFMQEHFALDAIRKGWVASCALLGCIGGAAAAGLLSDALGRKKVLLLAAVLFTVSAIGAAASPTVTAFVVARVLGGLGIGMASMLSPLYIAEVAPARIRGRMVSLNQLAIVSGIVVVYYVNALIADLGDHTWNVVWGWRWMFASGALPAVLFFGLLFLVPESPRWLTERGRESEARAILERVGGREQADAQMQEVRLTLAQETGSLGQLIEPGMRRPLLVALTLAVLQQITGINVVLYYCPEIFKTAGVTATQALNDTVAVGAVNMLFTLVAIWMVDKLGRKPLLLVGAAGMGVALALLGGAFATEQVGGSWVLICTLGYVAAFAMAMGPVVWVIMAEIFPTRIRGRAMSIATVCLWTVCYAVSQTFPWMLEHLEAPLTFWFYAIMCLLAVLFVAVCVPETKGKTLEEIERSWLNPDHAQTSSRATPS